MFQHHDWERWGGGICLPAPLSKSHHDSVLGDGMGGGELWLQGQDTSRYRQMMH